MSKKMIMQIKKIITSRFTLYVIAACSILPILWISFYNRPSADDFTYTFRTHQAVLQNESVLIATLQNVKYFMENWNGLFFSTFLQSLSWSIIDSKLTFLNTVSILVMLFIGIEFLLYSIINKGLKQKNADWKLLGVIVFLYIVQTFPEPVQALYWYNGAVNYTFMWAVFLISLSIMIQYIWNKELKHKKLLYVIGAILTILTAGGNHVVQGLMMGFSLLFSLYCIYKKEKFEIAFYFVFSFVAFIINMLSGGTEARWESMEYNHSILKSIIVSGATTVQYGIQWFTVSMVLLLLAAIIVLKPVVGLLVDKYKITIKTCIIVFIMSVVIIFCMNFIPTYAMGYAGSGRVTDIVYAMYVCLCVFNAVFLAAAVSPFFKVELSRTSLSIVLLSAIAYVAVFGMGTCIRMPYGSSAINALKEIVSGEARTYAMELDAREEYYNEHQGEDIVVEPLSVYPYTLYFADITPDQEDYKNLYSSYYYGINSVKVNSDKVIRRGY